MPGEYGQGRVAASADENFACAIQFRTRLQGKQIRVTGTQTENSYHFEIVDLLVEDHRA